MGSYSVSDIENISLTNGNVNLSIPLAELPPIAGGKLAWIVRAEYSSKLWDKTGVEVDQAPPAPNYTASILQLGDGGGWRVGGTYWLSLHHRNEDYEGIPPANEQDPDWYLTGYSWKMILTTPDGLVSPELFYTARGYSWKMILTTPDGAKHELRPVDYASYPSGQGNHDYQRGFYKDTPASDSINATMRYYSSDGSFLWAKIDPYPAGGGPQSGAVYLPDGTVVEHSNRLERIKDPNGNKIKIWSEVAGSVTTTHYQDELTGREIKYIYNSSTNTGQVQYQVVGGSWVTIQINWGTTRVFGQTYLVGDPCMTEQVVDTTINVVRSIVFPQTKPGAAPLQYSFSYNSDTIESVNLSRKLGCGGNYASITSASRGWGLLSQMVTPLGATVEYAYQWDGWHQSGFDPQLVPREAITQKRIIHDGTTDSWDFSIGDASGEVRGPDGSITTETFYPHDPAMATYLGGGDGRSGLVYRTVRKRGPASNPVAQVTTERHWTRLIFSGGGDDAPGGLVVFNPVVAAEYTTLHDPNGAPVKMSAKTFQYDYNGNVTQVTEYDWFNPNSVSRDAAGVPTGVPAGATVLRTTTNSYYNPATSASSTNVYAKRTLPNAMPLILNALQQTTTGPAQTQLSYDGQAYGVAPTKGNLTEERRWNNHTSQWVTVTHTYDPTNGNRISTTDPNGNVTQFFYDDATKALPTRVVVDPLNGYGPFTTTNVYDYWTGVLTSQSDWNGQVTTTDYTNQLLGTADPYMRPGVVSGPAVTSVVGGVSYPNQRRKVKTTYDDNLRQVRVESDLNTEGDLKLKSRTTTDQLGRTTLVERNEDGTANYTITSQTIYKQMGKITPLSNPKCSDGDLTNGWTRTTRDELGRVVEVATFSGDGQPPDSGTNSNWTGSVTTSYNANETTVTDQTGKARKSVVDGAGRLIQVVEDPAGLNYQTNYTYDALNNLIKVVQGTQTRYFLYDSLSRLIRARNPEQTPHSALYLWDGQTQNGNWSVGYEYFPNGNPQRKRAAAGSKAAPTLITTTYAYDGLNRNTSISYDDGVTPVAEFHYDGAPRGKGRLWSHLRYNYIGTGPDNLAYSYTVVEDYDGVGRALRQSQQFLIKENGQWVWKAFPVQRTYDLAGNVTSQTYPSNRVVNYNYDPAGRLSSFTGYLGDGTFRTYADQITYHPGGQLKREHFGTTNPTTPSPSTANGLYHNRHFNARQQLVEIRLSDHRTDSWNWNRGALICYYSNQARAAGNPCLNA